MCLVLGAGPAFAQSGLATITGIVTDNSGGAVPGVTVTATNQATNVDYTGVSTDAGVYTITGAPIGDVRDQGGALGLQERAVESDALGGADGARRLQDGSRGPSRNVSRSWPPAPSCRPRTPSSARSSNASRSRSCPVQGRNLSTAALYTAGVTTPNPASFNSLKNTGGGRPYVNGQREQGNNFMLDGVDMNDAIDNLIAYQPSPDAVEQVSVETNNYSPELGNVAGAVVNMVIKSGTNRVSRQRLLLLARQRPGGDAVGDQPRRRQEVGVQPQDLRRHGRRADREEQVVLLRRLPGRASEVASGRFVHDGHPRRVAQWRFEQPAGGQHADLSSLTPRPASRSRTTRFR